MLPAPVFATLPEIEFSSARWRHCTDCGGAQVSAQCAGRRGRRRQRCSRKSGSGGARLFRYIDIAAVIIDTVTADIDIDIYFTYFILTYCFSLHTPIEGYAIAHDDTLMLISPPGSFSPLAITDYCHTPCCALRFASAQLLPMSWSQLPSASAGHCHAMPAAAAEPAIVLDDTKALLPLHSH